MKSEEKEKKNKENEQSRKERRAPMAFLMTRKKSWKQ